MMNLDQTKLVGLTMELDLKAREYNKLCDKLEQLEQNNINPNDEKLLKLKQLFEQNQKEISEINKQLKELKEKEEFKEKQESYNPEKLFKKNKNISENIEDEKLRMSVIQDKKNIFTRLIEKIKSLFERK